MEPVSLPSKSCHQCPDIWCLVSARARGRAGVLWRSLHVRILCPVLLRLCKLAEIRPSLVTVLASMPGKVIVYGGRGGLGVVVVSTFRQAGYEVLSVDIVANTEAEHNVLVSLDTTWPGQEEQVCRGVEAALAVSQAGNIFCGA